MIRDGLLNGWGAERPFVVRHVPAACDGFDSIFWIHARKEAHERLDLVVLDMDITASDELKVEISEMRKWLQVQGEIQGDGLNDVDVCEEVNVERRG